MTKILIIVIMVELANITLIKFTYRWNSTE